MLKRTKEALDVIIPVLSRDPYVDRILLFGSQARGTSKILSDIDIAIVTSDHNKVNRRALNDVIQSLDIDVDKVFITEDNLKNAVRFLDVNYRIREEGIELWRRI